MPSRAWNADAVAWKYAIAFFRHDAKNLGSCITGLRTHSREAVKGCISQVILRYLNNEYYNHFPRQSGLALNFE